MKKNRFWLFATGLLLVAAGLFVVVRDGAKLPVVSVVAVDTGPVDSYIRITGTAKGPNDVPVIAQVSGIADRVAVAVGDPVAKNALLVGIASDDSVARVNSAAASRRMVSEELTLHETTLHGLRAVWQAGGEAEITVRNAETQLRVDQARLERANAELSAARSQLEHYTVRTPVAATISAVDVRQGQFVAAGKVLMSLRAAGPLEILAKVDQADAGLIHADLPVAVSVNGSPAVAEQILRIDPAIQKEGNTNYLAVWISARSAGLKVLPNQQVDVNIQTSSRASTLRLPIEAVRNRDGKDYVWLVDNGRLRSQPINCGLFGDHFVEIRSGLGAGQPVARLEGKALREGDAVDLADNGARP